MATKHPTKSDEPRRQPSGPPQTDAPPPPGTSPSHPSGDRTSTDIGDPPTTNLTTPDDPASTDDTGDNRHPRDVGALDLPPRTPSANPMNDGPTSHESGAAVTADNPAHATVQTQREPESHTPEGIDRVWGGDLAMMVRDVERHAKHSHGLTGDVDFLKKIARHLRALAGLEPAEADPMSVAFDGSSR